MDTRLYELTVVVAAEGEGTEPAAVETLVNELLGKVKGTIKDKEDWGVRSFAYEVRKQTQGHYYFYVVELKTDQVEALRGRLNLEKSLLRWLLVSEEDTN